MKSNLSILISQLEKQTIVADDIERHLRRRIESLEERNEENQNRVYKLDADLSRKTEKYNELWDTVYLIYTDLVELTERYDDIPRREIMPILNRIRFEGAHEQA